MQTRTSGFQVVSFPLDSPSETKQLAVFVHGWRMPDWEAKNFAETMFKRLYWQGFQGRLAALRWPAIRGEFDILISNPPYIPTHEMAGLDPEVRGYDPPSALDGGADGLRFFHRLLARMGDIVVDGWTVLEVGHDQADAVAALLSSTGSAASAGDIRFYRDVAGKRRCVAARSRI